MAREKQAIKHAKLPATISIMAAINSVCNFSLQKSWLSMMLCCTSCHLLRNGKSQTSSNQIWSCLSLSDSETACFVFIPRGSGLAIRLFQVAALKQIPDFKGAMFFYTTVLLIFIIPKSIKFSNYNNSFDSSVWKSDVSLFNTWLMVWCKRK